MDNIVKTKFTDIYGNKSVIRGKKEMSRIIVWVLTGILIINLSSEKSFAKANPTVARDSLQQIVVDSTTIHFQQSKYNLDLGLDGNGEKLKAMLEHLQDLTDKDSTYILSTVRVIGSASPEGSVQINRALSEKRAQDIFDYFAQRVSLPETITDFEFMGRNWRGLYTMVANDKDVPYRDDVLELLKEAERDNELSANESNQLLAQLKALKGGKPYAYMYSHLFPALRYSYLFVEFERWRRPVARKVINTKEGVLRELTTNLTPAPTQPIVIPAPVKKKPFYMTLGTNMLYDLAAVPNITADIYVGKNISVYADWMYAWWDKDRTHRYWRTYGGNIGARWWFGKKAHEKPLTGHHLGVYAGIFTFDFEWGGKGYMGGKPHGTLWDRYMTNASVEYGYSLPIGSRLNLGFTAALGYINGKYIEYEPIASTTEYLWLASKKFSWFGPTKVEVSLIWLIGRGNVNKK